MNGKIIVSVVLCTYNDEKFIGEAINSILNQSFSDFEFLIWNDGSTDGTEKIINSYKDNRIRYFYHENTGLGEALRLACKEARGKYLARMDADDISLPERLERQVKYMESHPECVLMSTAVEYIDEYDKSLGRSFPYTWNFVLKKASKYNNPFVHPASIFRKDAYGISKGYPGIRCFQDRILFRDLSKTGKVSNISTPLLKYRISSKSVSHSLGKYLPLLREIEKTLVESKDYKKEDIEHFNSTYILAKNSRKEQKTGFYSTKWYKLYNVFSIVMPNALASDVVSVIHNIMGSVYFFLR